MWWKRSRRQKTEQAVSRLMGNQFGPKEGKRRPLLVSEFSSTLCSPGVEESTLVQDYTGTVDQDPVKNG